MPKLSEHKSRTPEQRAADDALTEAVKATIEAYHLLPEGALFSDCITVVEGIKYRDGSDLFDDYHALVFRDGQMRTSVARGLLGEGLIMLDRSGVVIWESDDEDQAGETDD